MAVPGGGSGINMTHMNLGVSAQVGPAGGQGVHGSWGEKSLDSSRASWEEPWTWILLPVLPLTSFCRWFYDLATWGFRFIISRLWKLD